MAAKTLLVEGNDDFHVVLNLQGTRNLRVIDKEEIRVLGGVTELIQNFPVTIKANEGGIVGAVLDADTDLAGRWQSIRNSLNELGYTNIPEHPRDSGTILSPPVGTLRPRVGVWLMPNNRMDGILEHFLEFLIPPGDALVQSARTALESLPERRFSENDTPKAFMHTWLAWQNEPGRPFGQAITARFLDPDVAEAQTFLDWLFELYSE